MLKGITLKHYQQKAVDDFMCLPAIGLFFKAGAGKTYTALEKFLQNRTPNLLVICPQTIITQWVNEINKTITDMNCIAYDINWTVKKKDEFIKNNIGKNKRQFIVVNFEIIDKLKSLDLIDETWTIVVDESHRIKNMGTKRKPVRTTKRALELGAKTIYKIILTATPTEQKQGGYIDYYAQLRFLGYIDYSIDWFKDRYCILEKVQYIGIPYPITIIKGYNEKTIQEFKNIVGICCRYYAPKYGDYEPQHITVNIPKAKGYNKMITEKAYKDITIDNTSAMTIAKKTMTGGKITGTDELKDRFSYVDNSHKADWLKDFLMDTDDKVAILYQYNVELEMLKEVCTKLKKTYIVINGEVKDKTKELEKEFDVVLGQYQAFSESLDGLQYKCHLMIFYSAPPSSRAYRQSLGRIDRVGQTDCPVYYYLEMERTIDSKIYYNIENKIEYQESDLNDIKI